MLWVWEVVGVSEGVEGWIWVNEGSGGVVVVVEGFWDVKDNWYGSNESLY